MLNINHQLIISTHKRTILLFTKARCRKTWGAKSTRKKQSTTLKWLARVPWHYAVAEGSASSHIRAQTLPKARIAKTSKSRTVRFASVTFQTQTWLSTANTLFISHASRSGGSRTRINPNALCADCRPSTRWTPMARSSSLTNAKEYWVTCKN